MKDRERILLLRNQGIGDLILITPAIRAIRQLHPDAHLSIMVGDWSRSAIEQNPHLDEILSYPDPWIQQKQPIGYLKLVSRLFKKKFDVAYIFHSHPFIHLIPYLARVPRLYGFFDPELKKQGKLLNAKAEWSPNTDRYIADNYLDIPRLAGFSGADLSLDFHLSPEENQQADRLLEQQGLIPNQYFVVAPGGGVNPRQHVYEKRWGKNKFSELIRLLLSEFGLPIILTGSATETELGVEITQGSQGKVVDFIGIIPFRLSGALIAKSRFLVCNDSAVMHVAVAHQIPSLAIFGPSNPKSLLPISPRNQWISARLDCSPCYCNSIFNGCEHIRCMTELTPELVDRRIHMMMAESSQTERV
ncbi:MAG: glycosyltransferase family 9 protein [bacterium]|nr:glycosyltransferase family 9 protein [bacterium]